MKIEICFSPALYPYYHQNDAVVVVVDIFRATTSMVTAFMNGVSLIRPVATIAEAELYKAEGWLVGAERNVQRCSFADFGNSPFDYTPEHIKDKEVVMTTTNGTRAITLAKEAYRVVIGAFTNLQAVADYCLSLEHDVIVLCSGWNDRINIEDTLFGGALAEKLMESDQVEVASDAVRIALDMWTRNKQNPMEIVSLSDHMQRLKAHGLEDVVPYCLTLNLSDKVPELKIKNNVLYIT